MFQRPDYGDEREALTCLTSPHPVPAACGQGALRPPVPITEPTRPPPGAGKEELRESLSRCATATGTALRAAREEHGARWQEHRQAGSPREGAGDLVCTPTSKGEAHRRVQSGDAAREMPGHQWQVVPGRELPA